MNAACHNTRSQFKKGFTLIEILVSIVIVSMLSIVIVQVFFTTTRSNTKVELVKDVKQNGDYALDVMARMIRNARSVASTCTTGSGTTATSLTIENSDDGTTTFQCLSDSGVLRIASSSAYLTSANLTLTSTDSTCTNSTLQFTCIASDAQTPDSIGISFSLAQKGTPVAQFEKASTSFQTTVLLRNE